MRPPIKHALDELPAPDDALLAEARRAEPNPTEHRRFLERITALHALERRPPARPLEWPGRLRVAAFNAERLKYRPATRALLDRIGAHAALLSEVDVGMARSGNVHTIRDLIGERGEGYLYGVEFVELDLGGVSETRLHAGERNACGFHGNAVVTHLALEEPCLIPLEESGFWFPGRKGTQRRIGGRVALAARVAAAPRPLWLVSTHLESKTDEADRQRQVQALLRALDSFAPNDACIIGGDFNTKALPRGEGERHLLIDAPERFEPLFKDLRAAGFSWADSNLAHPTQRTGPANKPRPPFGKLDWLVVRGVTAENPQVVPVLDRSGKPISDHEMVAVDLVL
ncbi:endonuclease/exonuclease/phosphatase family protein [Microvirga sp. GCM10011540]|uniref:endonuclease/exonuclease/phosphatase family protein n=1 Tax=Microvirga sp. GCM10011540 TaxID=3317338 RepID=UPI00360DCF6F